MMQLTELRLGSIIESGVIARMDICEGCIFDMEVITEKGQRRKISNPSPIPLTEEWLLKFGFEFYPMEDMEVMLKNGWGDLSCHSKKLRSGKKFEIFKDGSSNYCETESGQIEHVHQLQNLYFALTGEELKVNSEVHTSSS